MKNKSNTQLLNWLREGFPVVLRSEIWPTFIGNDLNISPDIFGYFLIQGTKESEVKDELYENICRLINNMFTDLESYELSAAITEKFKNVKDTIIKDIVLLCGIHSTDNKDT